MTLAADTSPLIAFSCIRRLDVLRQVAEEILLPPAVIREVVNQGVGWKGAEQLQMEIARGEWFRSVQIESSEVLDILRQKLGPGGEAEAIAYAKANRKPVLLDELAGRKTAKQLGVEIFGSLRVLKLAKQSGAISQAGPLVREMQQRGIFYGDVLVEHFLREIGEFR